MTQGERELKFAIASQQDFERVAAFFPAVGPPLHQLNHYFSDQPERPDPHWSLRLRQESEPGQVPLAELTLKRGRRQTEALFEATETTVALTPSQAQKVLSPEWPEEIWGLAPLQELQQWLGLRPRLWCLGTLHNIRRRGPFQGKWVGELDMTHFPDGSLGYELEVELTSPELTIAEVMQDLAPLGSLLRPQSQTKFRRFLDRRPGKGLQESPTS